MIVSFQLYYWHIKMSIRSFYLKNTDGKYINVKVNENPQPTKGDYTLYYGDTPVSLWYIHDNEKHTNVINLHNSTAFYTAYGIQYKGTISLSYSSSDWKQSDGLSTCCFHIQDNSIRHSISNQILYCI
jgi:hypothetical protein